MNSFFIFQNRIPFRVADDPSFHQALEETRPGLEKRKILTRKLLAGQLLDETDAVVSEDMKSLLKNKMCVVSQDGWSNVHNEPIIASTIHCEGTSYPLDSTYTGTESKTANYCFTLLKNTITSAENEYGATVVGFVSDNEPKMKALRKVKKIHIYALCMEIL